MIDEPKYRIGDELTVVGHHGDHLHGVHERTNERFAAQILHDGDPLPSGGENLLLEHDGEGRFRVQGHLSTSGPAQVATPAYREHWDTIFGKKVSAGQA